jgi:hypothetical protein
MKRFRIIGLALLALFALGAFAASMASAEEGVLPLKVKTFNILSKKAKLENTAKEPINCDELNGSGSFTNDSSGTATLDFNGCESGGFLVWSLGEIVPKVLAEALILAPVSFSICLINSEKLTFGLFVQTTSPVHVDNTSIGILTIVEGAVIGEILTVKGKLFVVDFVGAEGKQKVTECKDEKGGVKKHSLTSTNLSETSKFVASELVEALLIQSSEEQTLEDK